jgi:hypothetical protein
LDDWEEGARGRREDWETGRLGEGEMERRRDGENGFDRPMASGKKGLAVKEIDESTFPSS